MNGILTFIWKKNMGLGMDIGATYDLTDRIVLSASLTAWDLSDGIRMLHLKANNHVWN